MRDQHAASTPHAFTLAPDAGEIITVVGDRLRVLADSTTTGGAVVLFDSRCPPGGGPPLHRHSREDEHFVVLEGTALFQVDGNRFTLGPGGYALVRRGSVHSFSNPGPEPLRMLIVCTPGGIEQPFRKADALGRQHSHPPIEQLKAIFAEHGIEILGPPLAVGPGPM